MLAATAQLNANTIDRAADLWHAAESLLDRARGAGADLIVFPETTYPAYWLESMERYRQSDIEPTVRVLERFSAHAARARAWLVVGFVEDGADCLYNSAALFDRAGRLIGITRKCFLWDCDHRWFTPGDAPRAFDTEFGPIGILICADARVPEIPATLVSLGARLIVQPTAWVNTSPIPGTLHNIQPDFLIPSRAREFAVPFICASKSGREADHFEYVGQSRIVDATGRTLAAAPPDGDHLITAQLQLARAPRLGITDDHRRILLNRDPPRAFRSAPRRCTLDPGAEPATIISELESCGVRFTSLIAEDLASFAPARCAALDGAQLVFITGPDADLEHARTRAAENRVFVLLADPLLAAFIDPTGTIRWRAGDPPGPIHFDAAEADLKQFTPTTNLWSQRRPESYRLDPPTGFDVRLSAT